MIPGLRRLGHHVLQHGPIQDGQKLLGYRAGNGKEAGPQTGGGDYGFTNDGRHRRDHITGPLFHDPRVGQAEQELAVVLVGGVADHLVLGGRVDVAQALLQDVSVEKR